ncbi:hypothetical protein YC2023_106896 [Brassica napus]
MVIKAMKRNTTFLNTRINSYLRLYHLYSDPQLSKFSKMEELRFQYGVTGGEAKKKALAYIYKCKGTLPQFSSMFEPNKYILMNFSFLGVRDVSLENCILIVRGEGLDEDKMRRKMDKILSSNPGCLSDHFRRQYKPKDASGAYRCQ